MTDYTNFRRHLAGLKATVYEEPKLDYHEKLTALAFKRYVSSGSFKDVLDVGFGTGYSLDKFKEMGMKPVGISLSQREVTAAGFIGHEVHLMDMNFLDFPDSSFDLVWCRHALEHSIMPTIALMEFRRVLRPAGYLYVEVPSDNSVHVNNANHFSVLSDGMWQALFRRVGFNLLLVSQFNTIAKMDHDDYIDIYWNYWLRRNE